MSYRQLTLEQRYAIYILIRKSFSKSSIAKEPGVSRSTIYRELQRNTGLRGYRYKQAQKKSQQRRHQSKNVRFTKGIEDLVVKYLKQDWSPEQISAILQVRHQIKISYERIYQFIWTDKHSGGFLFKHLRQSQKKRRKRSNSKDNRGQIKNRISIKNAL